MLFTLLLRASLAVVVGIFSFVVKLMQVARLRFRHKTCGRKEQVYVPFTQSRNLLVVVWLGDMTFKLKRCYRTFEFKSHVGYSTHLKRAIRVIRPKTMLALIGMRPPICFSYPFPTCDYPRRNQPITTRCRLSVRLLGVTFKGMNHGNQIPVYRPHPNPETLTRRLTVRELLRNSAKFCSCGVSCSESIWLS
jgi:hypothetical protein